MSKIFSRISPSFSRASAVRNPWHGTGARGRTDWNTEGSSASSVGPRTAGTCIETTSRLTEPVLLGLAVLALRDRVKR